MKKVLIIIFIAIFTIILSPNAYSAVLINEIMYNPSTAQGDDSDLESIELLANSSKVLAQKCVQGIKVNKKRCEELVEQSLAMVTALAPVIGYDQAAKIAKEAHRTGKTVREVVKAKKLLDEKKLDKLLNPRSMLRPK